MGDSSGSDEELTFWEERYGGVGGSSSAYGGSGGYGGSGYGSAYGGGPPPSVLDGSAFIPAFTDTDRGVYYTERSRLISDDLAGSPKKEGTQIT